MKTLLLLFLLPLYTMAQDSSSVQKPKMKQYFFVMLKAGPNRPPWMNLVRQTAALNRRVSLNQLFCFLHCWCIKDKDATPISIISKGTSNNKLSAICHFPDIGHMTFLDLCRCRRILRTVRTCLQHNKKVLLHFWFLNRRRILRHRIQW